MAPTEGFALYCISEFTLEVVWSASSTEHLNILLHAMNGLLQYEAQYLNDCFTSQRRSWIDPCYRTLGVLRCLKLRETQCQGFVTEIWRSRGWMIIRTWGIVRHSAASGTSVVTGRSGSQFVSFTLESVSSASCCIWGKLFNNNPGKPTGVLHLNSKTHVSHFPVWSFS